jgi:hypothetical protein
MRVVIPVRFDPEIKIRLAAEAKKREITISDLLRVEVAKILKNLETKNPTA